MTISMSKLKATLHMQLPVQQDHALAFTEKGAKTFFLLLTEKMKQLCEREKE
jgi:hypothetical protein